MATPYPLPRKTRISTPIAGDGGTVYGPFAPDWKIFDIEDVEIWLKNTGETKYTKVAATIAKEAGADPVQFTVTFASAVPSTSSFVYVGRRTHERTAAITKGGAIDSGAYEKELTKQAVVLQEARRDLDRALQLDADGGQFVAQGKKIADLADPVANQDAATKAFVESYLGSEFTEEAKASAAIAAGHAALGGRAGIERKRAETARAGAEDAAGQASGFLAAAAGVLAQVASLFRRTRAAKIAAAASETNAAASASQAAGDAVTSQDAANRAAGYAMAGSRAVLAQKRAETAQAAAEAAAASVPTAEQIPLPVQVYS